MRKAFFFAAVPVGSHGRWFSSPLDQRSGCPERSRRAASFSGRQGRSGRHHGLLFYWIDDENDFSKHTGQEVEIVGEISGELKKGQFEVNNKGAFTELEFEVGRRETKVLVPSAWLSSQTAGKDAEFDIVVRTVDVEKVTPLGPCR